jgi:hypothetical protein
MRIFLLFMEPEGSLPYSQEPTSEANESSPLSHTVSLRSILL